MNTDLQKVAAIIQRIGDDVLLAPDLQGRTADDNSPDRKIETQLIQQLGAVYPDAAFFAEEAYKADPSTAALLNSGKTVFIIDPIDNTTAFLEGRTDVAAIEVAKLVDGQLTQGWLYYPKLGIMLCGDVTEGAYHNGNPVAVAARHEHLADMTLAAFPNSSRSIKTISDAIDAAKPSFASVQERMSVCEHALDLLVHKTSDVLVNRVPWPWDTNALYAIYTAAGGVVGFPDGSRDAIHDIHSIGQILAPNETTYDKVCAVTASTTWPALRDYNRTNSLKLQSWGAPPAVN